MTTIQVRQRVPQTVNVFDVELPFYYKIKNSYRCITTELKRIDVYHYSDTLISVDVAGYGDLDEIAELLERDFAQPETQEIEAAVFHHKYSEVYRELHYIVFPDARVK